MFRAFVNVGPTVHASASSTFIRACHLDRVLQHLLGESATQNSFQTKLFPKNNTSGGNNTLIANLLFVRASINIPQCNWHNACACSRSQLLPPVPTCPHRHLPSYRLHDDASCYTFRCVPSRVPAASAADSTSAVSNSNSTVQ